jgi:hypothetical protein
LTLEFIFYFLLQTAFDAVKRAWTVLEDKETRKACMEVVEEARGRTRFTPYTVIYSHLADSGCSRFEFKYVKNAKKNTNGRGL